MRKPLGRKRICRMGERLFLETERLVTGKERQPGTRVSFTSEPSQVRKSHLRREFRTEISCRNRCLRSPASVILKLIEKHRQTRERCVNLILLRFFFCVCSVITGLVSSIGRWRTERRCRRSCSGRSAAWPARMRMRSERRRRRRRSPSTDRARRLQRRRTSARSSTSRRWCAPSRRKSRRRSRPAVPGTFRPSTKVISVKKWQIEPNYNHFRCFTSLKSNRGYTDHDSVLKVYRRYQRVSNPCARSSKRVFFN